MRYVRAVFPWFLAVSLAGAGLGCGGSSSAGDDDDVVDSGGTDGRVVVDAATDAGGGGQCGTCPTGYSCGAASGIAVCRKGGTGIPLFSRVFVIMMENTSYSSLETALNANPSVTPYLKSIQTAWATASNYHGGHNADGSAAHPSLPNYLVMTSGSSFDVGCDCAPASAPMCTSGILGNCSRLTSSCGCQQTAANLGDQLLTAGTTWKAYGEDMGAPCSTTDVGLYAVKHMPFLYYSSIQGNAASCAAHVVPYTGFAADLATPIKFVYVAPNLTHDMHDPSIAISHDTNLMNGDSWLMMTGLPPILALPDFQAGGKGLIVIAWDEDDISGGLAGTTDDPIPMFVISPLAKKNHFVSAVQADHKSLLATIEDGLGLPRLATTTSTTPLTDYFPAN
jgi:phosphatidylinositol-3-phosphatase